MDENAMIEEILKHLDGETGQGVARMSVQIDENSREDKQVDHGCCHMYGRPASETVALLDMYTDISHGEADR
ncbi:MAG: hypothetical protein J6K58_14500 [Lachnospiraceae bacterium]|nr:hypothetical protein [Lachnospiraceae bacterium]